MLPTLKGGSFGRAGTAPLVHTAAQLLSSGENGGSDPKSLIEAKIDGTMEEILPATGSEVQGVVDSRVTCPAC